MKRFLRINSLLALAAISLAGGCSEEQAPFNRLTGLRVLAIQSEPAAPGPGEIATLSALVYTPTDDPTLTYEWSWCPAPGPSETGYKCLVTEQEIAMFGQAPAYDLGMAPTAMLANTVDPAAFLALCAAVPGALSAPDCRGGFPIQINLTVKIFDPITGKVSDSVNAVATTRWRFADPVTQALQPANANPTIPDDPAISTDGLTATIAGMPQPMGNLPTFSLPRDTATAVRAEIPEGASEWYDGFDDAGMPAMVRERMFMTWFVESGDTDDPRTSFIEGRTPFDKMMTNSWTPARKKDYAPGTARLYVVLHDNRGGVGWSSGIVNLDETP